MDTSSGKPTACAPPSVHRQGRRQEHQGGRAARQPLLLPLVLPPSSDLHPSASTDGNCCLVFPASCTMWWAPSFGFQLCSIFPYLWHGIAEAGT